MELCLQKNTKKVGTPGLFQCTPKAEKSKEPKGLAGKSSDRYP